MRLGTDFRCTRWACFNDSNTAGLKTTSCLCLICFFIFSSLQMVAQSDIPVGTWRMHLSYNTINSVALGDNKIFGATENSIMVLDKDDNSVSSYSKLNGLNGASITFLCTDPQGKQLLVSYEDGNLDIIEGNNVTNFDRLKNSTIITGSKKINRIDIQSGFAYLSTDYGVVVFDLARLEVKETWRDLDVNGGTIKIYQSAFLGDSIFLASEKGVLAGKLKDNLLDYHNWKRYNTGVFNGAIQSLTTFKGKIYAAVNNAGIYRLETGTWVKESFLQGKIFSSMSASAADMLITENANLWRLDQSNVLTQIEDAMIVEPVFALEDADGKIWIGDARNGLVSDANGSFSNYLPNGPLNSTSQRLNYTNGVIYNLPGGYSSSFLATGNTGGFDSFTNGLWTNQKSAMKDLTDLTFISNTGKYYVSSFGYGIEERNATASVQVLDESNSPLVNINPPGRFVNITSLETSSDGLWVANYGASKSLHLLKSDNTWESFSFPITATRYPTDLAVDMNGYVWMVLNPAQGGGLFVFDKNKNQTIYFTDQPGAGGLPNIAVRSIAMDRDGYIWIGTDAGVAYFIDTFDVFSAGEDVIKPIYQNRYLLQSEKITAIAVDGGNRKWMGTERGVWLFNPTGEKLVYNFTTDNSPLLSNVIHDVKINAETGEVFFATDKGIVSFRSDATASTGSFQTTKIFPNPVPSNFSGVVAVSGLATDAFIKITDISGKLIWQTQANGGTASWNVRDYNGNRASTGVYLVFATSQDGSENIVGKIAVVD